MWTPRPPTRFQRRVAMCLLLFACGFVSRAASASDNVSAQPRSRGAEVQQEAAPPKRALVFWEDGFRAADTAAPARAQIAAMLPEAAMVAADGLANALDSADTRLLVLPFGSAFPEDAWPAIHRFLERGGNLLVLGGRPFTRAAYKDSQGWHLREPQQAFARTLFLNDYQETPGSAQLAFTANEDFSFLRLPAFTWTRAWSATVRLSDENLYPREGSAGTLDARLDTLAWGVSNRRKLAAPLIELDHLQNHFAGGRWIFLPAELPDAFWTGAAVQLVPELAAQALNGAEDFRAQPSWPVFLPGEPVTLNLHWMRFGTSTEPVRIELHVDPTEGTSAAQTYHFSPGVFPFTDQVTLPGISPPGLRSVTASLYRGDHLRAVCHTGFWIRDEAYLRSGPRVGVSGDSFTVDGKPILVAGTTYMASDVQRQFFLRPNPYVWDRDMAEIEAAGINTIRTGWWTGWDQVMEKSGTLHEEMLRTLEAYLMCARKHNLAVQFTFFAFIPEVFGGANPYLDPEAVRRQKELVLAFVERFRDVPFLSWDLINEPSFSNPAHTWQTRPNGDEYELRAWSDWLAKRYSSRGALAEAWRSVTVPDDMSVPLPDEAEFSSRAAYEAWPSDNALRALDYQFFAQDSFRHWASDLRDAIRATGSTQLVTVGEDEGGGNDRPSPAFFGDVMDFTTTHTWWAFDALLWDSLVAKLPGKPMLVQETGVSREVQINGAGRRNLDQEAALFERKLAMAAGTSAGAIEWLWNVNAYMRDDREATIGAVRPDGTEKPEAEVLRRFAQFAAAAGPHMTGAVTAEVAIVTSQALQFSPLQNLALEAQQKSVRAMNYMCGVPADVITENQVASVLANGRAPKLVILPAAQAFSEEAWQALVKYVANGGTLLVTGSMERDAHWRVTQRLEALGAAATPQAILLRVATQQIGDKTAPLNASSQIGPQVALQFAFDKQQSAEDLRFGDGSTFHAIMHGGGHIYVAGEPVELAEGFDAVAGLYSWALNQTGIRPRFDGKVPEGVLVRPVEFADSVLYLLVSESAADARIQVRDKSLGVTVSVALRAGRAEMLLFEKKSGRLIARYGDVASVAAGTDR
jgi:hypothetical protein